MALISFTLIPSSNKKNKGAKYPRFKVEMIDKNIERDKS